MTHPAVPHPREYLVEREARALLAWNDKALQWLADHVLASRAMFNLAFILPLLVLPMPGAAKVILAVVSSNWIQWWALPALQRTANKAEAGRAAKMDADHQALTHLALTGDDTARMVRDLWKLHLRGEWPQDSPGDAAAPATPSGPSSGS